MVGRVPLWFGIVALGPAISVTSIVNMGFVSLESVRVGLAHSFLWENKVHDVCVKKWGGYGLLGPKRVALLSLV